jgi:hypothetical protein
LIDADYYAAVMADLWWAGSRVRGNPYDLWGKAWRRGFCNAGDFPVLRRRGKGSLRLFFAMLKEQRKSSASFVNGVDQANVWEDTDA